MPRKHPGLATRLREFFERNPHEYLTRQDIVVKFSCSPKSLDNALKNINRAGRVLEAVTVWRLKSEDK